MIDETTRESARDWLLEGDEERFGTWLAGFAPARRQEDPWLLLLEGEFHGHRRRYPEAAACLDAAARAFETAGDPGGSFAAFGDLMGLAWERQDLEGFDLWARKAEALLPAATQLDRAEYWHNLACAQVARGELASAEDSWRKLLDLPRFGSKVVGSIQQFAALNLGVQAMERTQLEGAERHLRKVLALAAQQPLRPAVPYGARLYLARIAFMRDRLDDAEALHAGLPAAPDPYREAEALQLAADLALARGRLPEAEGLIEQAVTRFDAIGARTPDLGLALATLGLMRGRRGDRGPALELLGQALELAGDWPQYRASVLLLRAEFDPDPPACLQSALEQAERAQSDYLRAWAELRLGGSLGAIGEARIQRTGCWRLLAEVRPQATADRQPAMAQARGEILSIRALGAFTASVDDRAIASWPRKKAPVLLMLLALRPQGYSREDLAETLFPDLGPMEAEHQLDNLTSTLRKALQPDLGRKEASRFLRIQGRRYQLVEATWQADFQAFESGLLLAEEARRSGKPWQDACARALDLYQGALLDGPPFVDSFAAEREYYRRRYLTLALDLAQALYDEGHDEAAQSRWEQIIALEPRCVEAHDGLIVLFEEHGRTTLALAQRARRDRLALG